MENEKGFKTGNKKYLVYVILLAIVILALIIVPIFSSNNRYSGEQEDDGVTNEEVDGGSFVTMRNIGFLEEFIDSVDGSNAIINSLQERILADADTSDSSQTYTASVPSSSLIKSVYFPYDTCSFIINVSDGRSYNVQIAYEKGASIGMLVKYVWPENVEQANLYIYFLSDTVYSGSGQESVINAFVKWAKTIESGDLVLTTKNLFN